MDLLEQLTTTPGIPGREQRIRALIEKETKGLFDETRVDALGSLIGIRKPRVAKGRKTPKNPVKVMLAAHMDQIGFMVRHIDDKGFLRLNPVGGFDARNLFARIVTICTDKGDLPGVLNPGGRPVHIASPEDRKKIPEVGEFIVDLGLDAQEVKKRVQIGDMVVLKAPTQQIGNMVTGQCLDNRVACWIAIRALQKLKRHNCEIHCVFTVQEEVGLRGAGTAAFGVQPDIGIAIDTTLCVDTPGVPTEERVTAFGAGAALTCMDSSFISDLSVLNAMEAAAKKHKIPHQRSILPRGGTDSGSMQRAGSGTRVFTLSCPTRYIHTVTESVHLDDLHACRDLLAAYLSDV
jgi:putative aminopeptidase FrvX